MSISNEAVEAAKRVAYERYGSKPDTAYLRTILEAAAPHMLANAWEQGHLAGSAGKMLDEEYPHLKLTTNPYRPTP